MPVGCLLRLRGRRRTVYHPLLALTTAGGPHSRKASGKTPGSSHAFVCADEVLALFVLALSGVTSYGTAVAVLRAGVCPSAAPPSTEPP